jgi:hypothetical protein
MIDLKKKKNVAVQNKIFENVSRNLNINANVKIDKLTREDTIFMIESSF